MKAVVLLITLFAIGCQSVTNHVYVYGAFNTIKLRADVTKPIEVSPARSVEAKDNTVPITLHSETLEWVPGKYGVDLSNNLPFLFHAGGMLPRK